MNIRPDTALHQVISELINEARRTAHPSARAAAQPSTGAPAKTEARATTPPAGAPAAPTSSDGPARPRPRGSVLNILA